jgi:glycosyltransferase involved in cell wall biosynthesis
MQPELKVRKILGRTYLNENKLSEALEIFVKILMDYPDDLETILILGSFYLAGGDGKTARQLYARAQQLDPDNKAIQHQILLAEELEQDGFGEPVPTDMAGVSRLLQRLTGQKAAIQESDILRAAALLEEIINSASPADLVAENLDRIDDLLVALIEVNVRQAQADGRSDVAEALRALQLNIDCQRMAQADKVVIPQAPLGTINLLMLLPESETNSKRMSLLKTTLEAFGYHVNTKTSFVPTQDLLPDVVLTSNPHINPNLVDDLARLSVAGVPILLDLDADYQQLSISHPDYSRAGLGTHASSEAFTKALSLADVISVPSQVQADALGDAADRVRIIPDGWSRQNKLWEKDSTDRGTINLGWAGTCGELGDLALIRRYIIRILREFTNTQIVIIGDPQAYRLFNGLPEHRRKYIPLVAHEEFPYLLSQIDLLMVPLRNLPRNHSISDTILMEAGAKGIPWIASPIPAFRDWMSGGIIPETLDEWHLNLRHLVMDVALRTKLGQAGREAARTREMEYIGKIWLEVISQLVGASKLAIPSLQQNWDA